MFASLSILSEDSLAVSSFETIASSLHQRFNKNEHFQIGSAMVYSIIVVTVTGLLLWKSTLLFCVHKTSTVFVLGQMSCYSVKMFLEITT